MQVARTFFCEDLRLEENLRKYRDFKYGVQVAVQKRKKSKKKSKKGGKVNFLRGGLSAFGCAVRFLRRFMFLNFYKENIFSVFVSSVFIYIFHNP